MNISWVFADSINLDPLADIQKMKDIGSSWGSWKTWRQCQTDNVICHNLVKSEELVKRNFHIGCNFFIPNSNWLILDRPDSVKLYEGAFVDEFQPEEIIAMHLAADSSDIVLLMGFDLSEKTKNPDRMKEHRAQAYRSLVSNAISNNPEVQWVLVDHTEPIMKMMIKLENLTSDTLTNCLGLKDI